MRLNDQFPKAKIPDHLTRLSIEKLPLDTAFYISPGEEEDYEPPVMFVDDERNLRISNRAAIDIDDQTPTITAGLVGIMKTIVTDPETKIFREVLIADLRFIEDHQLISNQDTKPGEGDQEAYSNWLDHMNDTVIVDAFIAPELGVEPDSLTPKGVFYGSQDMHDSLKFLRKNANKIVKKSTGRKSKSPTANQDPTKEQLTNKQATPADLSVVFSDR